MGAYHEMGSNAIVMNRNIMKIVWRSTESKRTRNAYTFMILLHEYLHTLGFEDDAQVRELSRKITEAYVGRDHIAGEMAVSPLDKFFPEITRVRDVQGQRELRDRQEVRHLEHLLHRVATQEIPISSS